MPHHSKENFNHCFLLWSHPLVLVSVAGAESSFAFFPTNLVLYLCSCVTGAWGQVFIFLSTLKKKSYQTKIFAVDIGIFLFRFCYFSFILSLACVIHILCILLLACLSRIHEFALAYATISLTCIWIYAVSTFRYDFWLIFSLLSFQKGLFSLNIFWFLNV